VIPAVAGTWLDHFQPNLVPREWTLAAAVVFANFVIMNLLRYILQAPRVDSQVLCAGCSRPGINDFRKKRDLLVAARAELGG
jgi:hypothetical protein